MYRIGIVAVEIEAHETVLLRVREDALSELVAVRHLVGAGRVLNVCLEDD